RISLSSYSLLASLLFATPSGHAHCLYSFLHDALPISAGRIHRHHHEEWLQDADHEKRASQCELGAARERAARSRRSEPGSGSDRDRKSTRLNSSHQISSYAVFCLKKKNKQQRRETTQS